MPGRGRFLTVVIRAALVAASLGGAAVVFELMPVRAEAPPIVFYGDENLPPYEFLDARTAKGANVDLLKALGKILNRPVEIRLMKWAEAQEKVRGGAGDALSLMTPNAERAQIYAFSDETFKIESSLFVRTSDFEDVRLDPHRIRLVAVLASGFPESYLRKERPEMSLVPVPTLAEGMRLLLRGSVDAVAAGTWTGKAIIADLRISTIRPLPVPFAERSTAIAVPHAWAALLTDINHALRQLKADGAFDRIIDRWSGDRVVVFSHREVWLVGIAATLLLLTLGLSVTMLVLAQAKRRALDLEIGKRREIETELRESEARFRSMADDAPVLVWVTDPHGACIYLSRRWYAFTGFTPESGLGSGWLAAVHADERTQMEQALLDACASHDACQLEYRLRRADGDFRRVIHAAVPRVGENGAFVGMIGSIIDITERKQAEERQALLVREVSHRAKNALAVVQAVVRMTRAETTAEFISAVESRVSALARAHNMLAASNWVGAFLRQCVQEELLPYAGARGQVDIDGPEVVLEPEAVQPLAMVLHELTTNAVKYGALSLPTGNVTVNWAYDRRGFLRLTWCEQGGPPAVRPARDGFGSILINRCVTDQLGGELTLDWSPGGLTCELAIPLRRDPSSPGTNTEARLRRGHRNQAPAVLIVEDEALVALELESTLRELGYRVIGPVGREDDAMNLVRSTTPDAAVLDVNLQGRSVAPLALYLLDMLIPVLFCSGYADLSSLPERLQGAPLLNKPVDCEKFKAAIQRLLHDREPATRSPSGAAGFASDDPLKVATDPAA